MEVLVDDGGGGGCFGHLWGEGGARHGEADNKTNQRDTQGYEGGGWVVKHGGNKMGVENECVWEGCEVEGKVGRVVCVGGKVSVE